VVWQWQIFHRNLLPSPSGLHIRPIFDSHVEITKRHEPVDQDIYSRHCLQEDFHNASVFYGKGENGHNACYSFRPNHLTGFQMLTWNDACFVYVIPSGDWVLFPRSECVGVTYACDHTVEWFPQSPVRLFPNPSACTHVIRLVTFPSTGKPIRPQMSFNCGIVLWRFDLVWNLTWANMIKKSSGSIARS
jgi:hypothetical protein